MFEQTFHFEDKTKFAKILIKTIHFIQVKSIFISQVVQVFGL